MRCRVLRDRTVFFVLGLGTWGLLGLTPFSHRADSAANVIQEKNLPRSFRILDKGNFVIGYDQRSKVASWVYETLTPEMLEFRSDREKGFRVDHSLRRKFRSRDQDYRNSGYTRGHLSANANFAFDRAARKATDIFSNVAPQLASINGGPMKGLEERVRRDVMSSKITRIVTGPIFQPRDGRLELDVIGKSGVWVPTGFYKAWSVDRGSGAYEVHAVTIDHVESAQAVEISIDELERRSSVELPKEFH